MNQLIGYFLGDAITFANSHGYTVANIAITAPPKLEISEYDDSFRVLRVYVTGNNIAFLVCKPL